VRSDLTAAETRLDACDVAIQASDLVWESSNALNDFWSSTITRTTSHQRVQGCAGQSQSVLQDAGCRDLEAAHAACSATAATTT